MRLFSPLDGEKSVDPEVITQAQARLREQDPKRYTFQFDRFNGTRGAEGREPTEIILVCVDCSGSMDIRGHFLDMPGSNATASASQLSRVIIQLININ